jgi:hypothetical protein
MVFTSVVFPFLASNLLSLVPLIIGILLLNQKGLKGGLLRGLATYRPSAKLKSKVSSYNLKKIWDSPPATGYCHL